MRAVTIRNGEVAVAEHPDPEPEIGEVLVRVHAAGLNGADQMQLRGLYPPPPGSRIPDDIP
jgi:NADPH:quinone reductase